MKSLFSLLHCNIRNYDNLVDLINNLNFDFSTIGLSEIKFQVGKNIYSNTSINNYSFLSQPSLSAAGGVGFYINNKMKFSERDDLNTTSNSYESISLKLAMGGGGSLNPLLGFFSLKFLPLDQLPNAFAQLFLDNEDIF